MAASGKPSDVPAWLRNAVPYEPPAAAGFSTEDLVEPLVMRGRPEPEPGSECSTDALSADVPTDRMPFEHGGDVEAEEVDGCKAQFGVAAEALPDGIHAPTAKEPDGTDDAVDPAFTSKVVQWSRRAATGVVLSGIAGGLQRVFEPDERPGIVMEVPAPAPDDMRPVRLVFVPGDPKASIAFVRPWLLRSGWPQRG